MVTNSLQHQASVKQALDNLNLDYANGDTGLQVESKIDEESWVRLTSMRNGLERPPIPRIHAARNLGKTLPDGSPAFWMKGMPYDPPVPQIGSIKCYFHPEFDEADGAAGFDRAFIDQAGLQGFNCNSGDISKSNRGDFKSEMQRDSHMKSRHRRQLETVERAQGSTKEKLERAEQSLRDDYQRQQTETMIKLMERQIGAVSTEAPDLAHLNADGLRAYAEAHSIKLTNRQSVTVMREEIEAAS